MQMTDARARLDRHITPGLDAETPGVRTTRLVRPRTSSLGLRELACARTRNHAKTLSAPCRRRESLCSRFPALQGSPRPTPSRPSLPNPRFVTIAIRPLSRVRVSRRYDKSEFGKVEYFGEPGLTGDAGSCAGVLPDGQDGFSYSADNRTIWRPPFISLRLLTKFSGRCQRLGTFNPMYSAMSPMKPVQLVVSAFQTGEFACNFLI